MAKNILVVEDDVAVANLIASSLRGYNLTVAHNGAEAIALAARDARFDLLITDYLLPVMAGDALAERVRALQPGVKTVLLTGYGDLLKLDTSGTDAHLAKPFVPRQLRETVARLIGA